MTKYKDLLNEIKLSRVLKHTKDKEIPLAILTAFRNENTQKENKKLNNELISSIKAEKLGFFKVEGSFIEDEGLPTEKKVKEDSIFIIGNKDDKFELRNFVLKMIKKFKQESAIFKPLGTDIMFFLEQNGEETKVGKFRTNIVSDFMSKIKGSKDSFVFESVKYARNSPDIKLAKLKGEEDYMFKTVWKRK